MIQHTSWLKCDLGHHRARYWGQSTSVSICRRHDLDEALRPFSSGQDPTVGVLNSAMCILEDRSSNSNLLLNAKKTKQMMKNTEQISRVHKSKNQLPQISANGKVLERVTSGKFLSVWI